MESQIRQIVERFWKDVASLPWTDPGWINNQAQREQTRQHFVNATVEDILNVTKEKPDAKEK